MYNGKPGQGIRIFCPGSAITATQISRAEEQPEQRITSCDLTKNRNGELVLLGT